jgi:transposase, IS30 family
MSSRQGFTWKLKHVPTTLRKTLPYDRGKEKAKRLAILMSFGDLHTPWQHGTNGNSNGLFGQYLYLPKGTNFSHYIQARAECMARRLNSRPRKCLNWAKSLQAFTPLCHQSSIGLGPLSHSVSSTFLSLNLFAPQHI